MDAMQIPNDCLLDHAQGRLSPAELAEISRLMAEDAGLQARYAELRRLRRLVRECYQPAAVARPDARDEEMAGTIAGFVDAIRSGVLADAPQAMQDLAAGGEYDYAHDESPSQAGTAGGHVISGPWLAAADSARISHVMVDGARGTAARRWRSVAAYAAAAAVLLMAAWWSVGVDEPMVDSPASTVNVSMSPIINPIEAPLANAPGTGTADATTTNLQPANGSNGNATSGGNATVDDTPRIVPDGPEQPVQPGPGNREVIDHNHPGSNTGGNSSRPQPIDVDHSFADARRAFQSSSVKALSGSPTPEADGPRVIVGRTLLRGDVDGNGVLDERDYRVLRERVLANNAWQLGAVADVNGDNAVDTRDLATLLTIAAEANPAARGN